jgi:hypothetical protein
VLSRAVRFVTTRRPNWFGFTPTAAQRDAAAPYSFDHDPALVQVYYEGPGGGRLPGYNWTQQERLAWARNIDVGQLSTREEQLSQGANARDYSMAYRRFCFNF